MHKLLYTLEELEILYKDDSLRAEELNDEELEICLNEGWLLWTRENCNRLLRA